MKLPLVLFAVYAFILTNRILANVKASSGNSGVMYARKPSKIYEEAVINTLTELSVTACVLSCETSGKCFKAAIRQNGATQNCLHLKKLKKSRNNGKEVDVDMLEDTSPGNLVLYLFETLCDSKR